MIKDPIQECKELLQEKKKDYIDKNIWPSDVRIIDRLLSRDAEMRSVYLELGKLTKLQKTMILREVLSVAASWNPQKAINYRAERERLTEINQKIGKTARQLSELIAMRDKLHNESGFTSDTHYSIVDVLDVAARNNNLYAFDAMDELIQLRGRFDLKYWPLIENVVQELSNNAINSTVTASDSYTHAATSSRKSSLADFFRVLLEAFEENTTTNHGYIPAGFRFTDRSLANIANCALDIELEKMIDSEYVKRCRQRLRNEK